jgi:hypothetical protein
MATVSGTLTAPGQSGNFLFLRAGELATVSVSRTGSNAWSAELVATENQPPGRLPAVARFTSNTAGFTYRNNTSRPLYLTIVAGLLSPTESIAFTIADVTGDVILQDWVAPDGSLAFRITDEGPIGGVNGPTLNVKAFGAKGDGVTDDTAAIQEAIDTAYARFLATISDPYGSLRLGGATVYLPSGYYLTTDTLRLSESVSLYGDGNRSSVIRAIGDARVIEMPRSINYNAFGTFLRDFGILGDRTKTNQVGLSTLSGFAFHWENLWIQNCGSHGIEIRQGLNIRMDNVEVQQCVGAGCRITGGTNSWTDSTATNFPTNMVVGTLCHFAFNDGPGLLLDVIGTGGANGCVFYGGSMEYNYFTSTAGVGYNAEFRSNNFVANELVDVWMEGPQKAHVYVNSTNVTAVTRLTRFKHFGNGSSNFPERAVIVDVGTVKIVDATSSANSYRNVAGSTAPFRLNKAGMAASIEVSGSQGAGITNNRWVEDEAGNTTGLFNQARIETGGNRYGNMTHVADGTDVGQQWFRSGDAEPFAQSAPFYRGWSFGNGAVAPDVHLKRLAVGVFGAALGDSSRIVVDAVSANRGDTNVTLQAGVNETVQIFSSALTDNRTVTLSTTGATNGDRFRVVRTGLGAFTLDVGGLKTIPSATAAFVDVAYNGSAWVLAGYGTL